MRVKVSVADLSLKEVGDLLKLPNASGTARGDWTIDIPLPDVNRDRIAARGELRSGAVALGAAGVPLSADEIVATMQLRNGVFSADPIALSKNAADTRGSATANVQLALRTPKQPQVGFAADAWPIRISENGSAAVWAKAQLGVDATSSDRVSVTGPVNLRAKIATTQQAVGELAVEGRLDGRRGTFEKILLDALGGRAEGRAVFDADAPNQTNATLTFSGIDTARLAALVPQLSGISGIYSGTLAVSPAPSGRALEPLRVTVGLDPEGEARFRTVALGAALHPRGRRAADPPHRRLRSPRP
jgi:hypothetical protein